MLKLLTSITMVLLLGWIPPLAKADSIKKPGILFHKRLPLKKKEEIRIVDDYTVEVSLGSDNKWVSSNIHDALKSIPMVSGKSMPAKASFRGQIIFFQPGNGRYSWDRKGKQRVKLTSKDIREKGNIIIQIERPSLWDDPVSPAPPPLKKKEPEPPRRETSKTVGANIDGFRSSKFGMTQQEVLQAIQKDFAIDSQAVKKGKNPSEQTGNLTARVTDLLPGSGQVMIVYLFGYQSQKLYQVNLFWGKPFDPEPNPAALLKVVRDLQNYFSKKGFAGNTVQKNVPLSKELMLVFKGADAKGRMVEMILNNPQTNTPLDQGKKVALSLRLSYIEDPANLDIFTIHPDDF